MRRRCVHMGEEEREVQGVVGPAGGPAVHSRNSEDWHAYTLLCIPRQFLVTGIPEV